MTSTLKCVSCNIIIDELLAYIQNKVSLADEASLVKICASVFTSEQIQNAKTLLLESLSSELRSTVRKGKGKESRVLNDIIGIFKATDPEELPVFVARDLNKLPPITFDHLDVSQLLKDLTLVQAEIRTIKSSYVTQEALVNLKKECEEKYSLLVNNTANGANANVNTKRGAFCDEYVSEDYQQNEYSVEDPALSKIKCSNYQNANKMSIEGSAKSQTTTSIRSDEARSSRSASERGGASTSSRLPVTVTVNLNKTTEQLIDNATHTHSKSYASVVSSKTLSNDGFTLVQKKRKPIHRFNGSMGTSIVESEDKFKAADRKIPMFISNVHRDTLESDIINYIMKKTDEKVNLEKINIKRQCEHNAYKFFVSQSVLPMYLDEKLWPQGIIFRRFINYKMKRKNETSTLGNELVNNE